MNDRLNELVSSLNLTEVIPKNCPTGLIPTVNVGSDPSQQSTDKCTACDCNCDCNDCWCSVCK